MNQFKIGKVLKPHGRQGYLKVDLDKNFVDKYLKSKKVKLKKDSEITKRIENIKWHKDYILLKLEGINSIESAEKFRNYYLVVEKEDLEKLEEGTYYYYQLKNCEVYINSTYIGKVLKVDNFGSSDILFIQKENTEEVLIPFIKKIIKEIDVKNKKIQIKKAEGLQI